MRPPRRAGFSLLEVLLAISILLGAAIVLAELAAIGREHVTSAEETATAQRICQVKLNEMLAGVAMVELAENREVIGEPGWVYSVEVDPINRPGMQPGLAALRVTVSQDVPDDSDKPPRQFSLTRWIRDPYSQGGTRPGAGPPEDLASRQSPSGGFRP